MKTRFRLKHCQKYTMTTLLECKVSQGSLILIGHLLGQVFHPEKIQCHKQHSQKEQVEDIFLKKKKKKTECLSLLLYMLAISGENKTSPLEISQNSQQDPCLEIPHYFSLITCGEVPPLVLELPHTCSFFIQYP